MKSEPISKRIALIELDSSHDECLLTQVNALKKHNCWVLLITNEIVRKRNGYLEALVDEWIDVDPKHGKKLTGAAIGDALIIRRLMRTLKRKRIDKAVFNTAQGGHVRNACLFSLFRKIEFLGIIHTARKFQGSFTQRIINLKIKKYFVLAEFLQDEVIPMVTSAPLSRHGNPHSTMAERSRSRSKKHHTSKLQLESFYPLDFPKNDSVLETDNALHISIIGSVEMRRKDLNGFLSLVEQSSSDVHFHFLGVASPINEDVIELKKQLKEIGRLNTITFFDSFLPFGKIDQILRKSTAILPLIHPDTPSAEEYFRHQIPGAMSVALGYQIPLLLHEGYEWIQELNDASVYYNFDSFPSIVNNFNVLREAVHQAICNSEKYTSKYQYSTYLHLLFD